MYWIYGILKLRFEPAIYDNITHSFQESNTQFQVIYFKAEL